MVMWQLWEERNSRLWDGNSNTHVEIIHAAACNYSEWDKAQKPRNSTCYSSVVVSCLAWHPPPVGRRKLNVDALFPRFVAIGYWDGSTR
ncbi:hypothetical protein ACS0TY_011472 [Phlomoides rotata]